MKRILASALLISFLVFGSCSKTQTTNNANERTPGPRSAEQPFAPNAAPTDVTVWFRGLMLFHPESGKPGYEVGILAADDHVFALGSPCTDPNRPPTGQSLTLQITNPGPGATAAAAVTLENGHPSRRPDTPRGQSDFSWIIDLEGQEFHNQKLTLQSSHLKPIIHLPNGQLFTQYKSIDLQREQGPNGPFVNFGFVPETIGLHLRLQPGQQLVMKDDASGSNIFSLPCQSPDPSNIIWITNTRIQPVEASDFGMYYDLLFPSVPKADRFDFQANNNPDRVLPLNLDPSIHVTTCCQMACTAIFLGKTTDPLK